ncbi:Zinc-binding alcohol dehydrogenase domain-containing protein cipB [Cytospora mali]|uniref:Zinc-binding alcohol dehydrogenase domain-containing protein cipB n=1 Tax=Cytospora mali TaxID=578113 RepID=A0A194VUW3_CYTMA|nr:Zinc-binding alcohol dehydrogenase domain-containing protein cipB [Valsa mali]
MASSNGAAWLKAPKEHPLVVEPAPYPTPGDKEVIIKVGAIAVNPMDWIIQGLTNDLFSWLPYPYIGGTDASGTVVDVGSNVTKFRAGDRIVAFANCFAGHGAFQRYVAVHSSVAAPIPGNVSLVDAAVLPMGISSAAVGLYQKDMLALQYPTPDGAKPTGQTLLVWAGASSVGTNALQLAVASGYEVFTTASPRNFDYCRSLGAARVFDYKSPTVVTDIVAAFKGKTCAGALAVQSGTAEICGEIVSQIEGNKFVAMAETTPATMPEGVTAKALIANTIRESEVGAAIFDGFLPQALAKGQYQCQPPAVVVGEGLGAVQEALDRLRSGVASAQKLVVTL